MSVAIDPWPPPDQEKGHTTKSAALGKTVPGGSGKTNDSAQGTSAQASIPEYGRSWHSFVTWATGQQFAPTKHMVRIIIAEIEDEIEGAT